MGGWLALIDVGHGGQTFLAWMLAKVYTLPHAAHRARHAPHVIAWHEGAAWNRFQAAPLVRRQRVTYVQNMTMSAMTMPKTTT